MPYLMFLQNEGIDKTEAKLKRLNIDKTHFKVYREASLLKIPQLKQIQSNLEKQNEYIRLQKFTTTC